MEPARKALRAEEKSRFPDMLCRTGSLPHAAQRCFRRRSAAKDRAGKLKKAYRRRRHDNACVWEKAPCPAGKIPAKNTPGAWAWRAGAEKTGMPGRDSPLQDAASYGPPPFCPQSSRRPQAHDKTKARTFRAFVFTCHGMQDAGSAAACCRSRCHLVRRVRDSVRTGTVSFAAVGVKHMLSSQKRKPSARFSHIFFRLPPRRELLDTVFSREKFFTI